MSKFLVVGAGAIGGMLAVHLALKAKVDVTVIARGEHLKAIQSKGLRLICPDGTVCLWENVAASDDLNKLTQKFDVIFVAVKSHQIAPIADRFERLCHEKTMIVPLQNGIPWWYFYKHGGKYDGLHLSSLDPDGKLRKNIRLERIVGAIAFGAASITEPGVIHHTQGYGFPLGEPDRSQSERATWLSKILISAGFKAPVRPDFREEIWLKLLGNLSFNPVSALTGATIGELTQFDMSNELCRTLMHEGQMIAQNLGCELRATIDRRMEKAQKSFSRHKTSMLQDVENGKPLEVDIINAVLEVSELTNTDAPTISAIAKCTNLLNHVIENKIKSRL
mmetsp:Transcript_9605/g.12547  ORF Transcript_9605/g.12547 Transcript_9605/m.12547 type:complete len:335 (-) Transcript_9605:52-1056(-)